MTSRQLAVVVGIAMAASIGCSVPSEPVQPSTPTTEVVASVQIPPPESRSPQVTVEGEATWLTGRPGCISLVTEAGQRFQLSGSIVLDNEHRARAGEQPRAQRVHVTGYVPERGASACHLGPTFVAEKVTAVSS